MTVRARTDDDLAACTTIAAEVHAVDGYPPYLPDGDFLALLTRPQALGAWVAADGDRVLGHVALHTALPSAAMTLARDALECDVDRLGVVARLFTDPGVRRRGTAGVLLDAATNHARARGLAPVLDVWIELTGAIRLYESHGWRRLGTVDDTVPDGRTLTEHVYAAP